MIVNHELPTHDSPVSDSKLDWGRRQQVMSYHEFGGKDSLARWRSRRSQPGGAIKQCVAEESTLARYIERFRNSEPKSRQERDREKAAKIGKDFWWLRSPTGAENRKGRADRREIPNGGGGDTSWALELERRTDILLERSESTTLSEAAVSTDGVGNSPSYSDYSPSSVMGFMNADRPVMIAENLLPDITPSLTPAARMAATFKATRPEDDILHQWRTRRRMEEARKGTGWGRVPVGDTARKLAEFEITQKPQTDGSCLKDFRNRLQQQELALARPSLITSKIHGTLTSNAATDPIPQDTATQTNSDGQTANGTDPNTMPIYERGGPVYSHSLNTRVNQPHHLETTPPHEYANPATNSRRDGSRNDQSIPGHLHMACDIIPCHVPRGTLIGEGGFGGQTPVYRDDVAVTPMRGETVEDATRDVGNIMRIDEELDGSNRVRSTLKAAVGQVISQHLFTLHSNISPQSSMDTLPSMHSSLRSHSTDVHNRDNEISPIADSSLSDDEEFADDEVLQMLKNRRVHYQNQLRTLERLLSANNGGKQT